MSATISSKLLVIDGVKFTSGSLDVECIARQTLSTVSMKALLLSIKNRLVFFVSGTKDSKMAAWNSGMQQSWR